MVSENNVGENKPPPDKNDSVLPASFILKVLFLAAFTVVVALFIVELHALGVHAPRH